MKINPKCWRAPKWSPLWLRRAFPGCWTQEEIDAIQSRAHENYLRMQQYIDRSENGILDQPREG